MKYPGTRSLARAGSVLAVAVGLVVATMVVVLRQQSAQAHGTVRSGVSALKLYNSETGRWASTIPGFHIVDMSPGEGSDQRVYLRNNGDRSMQLALHVPELPQRPHGGYGFSGWQNLTVRITGDSCGDSVDTTMAALLSRVPVVLPCGALPAGVSGNPSVPGHVGNYTLHFDINPSSIKGDRAKIGRFSLEFVGSQPRGGHR